MKSSAVVESPSRAHQVQQIFKWIVYSLLFINWIFYILEDWGRWTHTAAAATNLFDLTSEFATSIAIGAWFILLAMLELETYVLDDEVLDGWISKLLRGIRLVCFLMIAHTVFAFADGVIDYEKIQPVEGVTNLCEMADASVSHVYNLLYTEVNEETCGELPVQGQLYMLGEDPLVVDWAGLQREQDLVWSDLIEIVVWLIILAAIEIVVRLQDRGITSGRLMSSLKNTKLLMYLILTGLGVYWAVLGHWLYTWDTLLWIGGFAAIEMNVSEWKDEILEARELVTESGETHA